MGNAQLKDFDDEGGDFVDELKPGTKLMHGQYEIEKFLNAGGFGITYLAKDSLDRKIVIKECFPGAFCRRSRTIVQARSRAHQPELKSIVRLFIQEARSLAKMDHPNIVGVHQVFEDNETAYMALDFVEGRDLLDTLEDPDHGLTPDQIKSILRDILGAVGFIHDQEILHRDISPDNILIDQDLRPVLIDFGAAREQATKQSRVLSALRVVKDGYSPQEFYIAGSEQNASSDLYALGASFYHLIANEVPPNSQARLAAIATGEKDPYVPLSGTAQGYDKNFLAALDMSLQVLPKDRVQTAADWIDMIDGKGPAVAVVEAAASAAVGSTSDKPKSKMPLLMASVAAVALLGVGVATQTDILGGSTVDTVDDGAGQSASVAEPVVAPAVQAPAEEVETAAAPVVEEPTVAAPVEEVEVAAAPVVEEPAVAAPAEEAEVAAAPVVEEPAVAAPADEVEVAAAPVVEEQAVTAPAEEIEVAAAPVVEETVIAEPRVIEPFVDFAPIAGEKRLVNARERANTGLISVSLRPSDRPSDLVPLPNNVATPEITQDAVQTTALPELVANVPEMVDTQTPTFDVPALPTDIAGESVQISFEAPALIPGNEIIEEPAVVEAPEIIDFITAAPEPTVVDTVEAPRVAVESITTEPTVEASIEPVVTDPVFVLTGFSVALPFEAASAGSNKIGTPGIVAPTWVVEGATVKSVNGVPVDAISDISPALRTSVDPGEDNQVLVTFEIETNGVVSTHDWPMQIRQDYQLLNGVTFGASFKDDVWTTVVTGVPASVATDLEVGDQLIGYVPTSFPIDKRTSMKELFDKEVPAGTTQYSFAVNRANAMWIAGLEYKVQSQ